MQTLSNKNISEERLTVVVVGNRIELKLGVPLYQRIVLGQIKTQATLLLI